MELRAYAFSGSSYRRVSPTHGLLALWLPALSSDLSILHTSLSSCHDTTCLGAPLPNPRHVSLYATQQLVFCYRNGGETNMLPKHTTPYTVLVFDKIADT